MICTILARLDGTNKSIKHTTFEDYLQMDGWEPPPTSTNGKKRVSFTKNVHFGPSRFRSSEFHRIKFSSVPNKVSLCFLYNSVQVRWADIEHKREQDKQRAIGFVVGQTNWENLIESGQRDDGQHALEKIKYIEKVKKLTK